MNKSIEQSLTGLLPSLNGPLPVELVNLASSLLAQSRSKASSLKAEEEIARSYACAQLACERLKKRLDLPTIISRPPCPPQAYKKLYAYFSTALPSQSTRSAPSTPEKRKLAADRLGQSPAKRTTPSSRTPSKQLLTPSKAKGEIDGLDAVDWAHPIIRRLCKDFSTPAAIPHVFAGLSSVLALQKQSEGPVTPSRSGRKLRQTAATQKKPLPVSKSHLLARVAVILFYVLSRMTDQDITPEQFVQWRAKTLAVFNELPISKRCNNADILADIDELMPLAQEEGWVRMDWFLNIIPDQELGSDEEDGEDLDAVNGAHRSKSHGVRAANVLASGSNIGLATMMQDATDYLSEKRRSDYLDWKAGIMTRIEEIESAQTNIDS